MFSYMYHVMRGKLLQNKIKNNNWHLTSAALTQGTNSAY